MQLRHILNKDYQMVLLTFFRRVSSLPHPTKRTTTGSLFNLRPLSAGSSCRTMATMTSSKRARLCVKSSSVGSCLLLLFVTFWCSRKTHSERVVQTWTIFWIFDRIEKLGRVAECETKCSILSLPEFITPQPMDRQWLIRFTYFFVYNDLCDGSNIIGEKVSF